MKKGVFIILLVLSIIFVSINVKAALPPSSANFVFEINKDFIKEGIWGINLISCSSYKLDYEKTITHFSEIKEKYIKGKNLCWDAEFKSVVDPKTGGGHIESSDPKCDPYSSYYYSWGEYYPWGGTLKFSWYHLNNYYHFDGPSCIIKDGKCDFLVSKDYDTKNPFFVVLEKYHSNEIYFSDPITIPWEYPKNIQWTNWASVEDKGYELKLKKFEIQKPNKLIIDFKGANHPLEKENIFQKFWNWMKKFLCERNGGRWVCEDYGRNSDPVIPCVPHCEY